MLRYALDAVRRSWGILSARVASHGKSRTESYSWKAYPARQPTREPHDDIGGGLYRRSARSARRHAGSHRPAACASAALILPWLLVPWETYPFDNFFVPVKC